MILNAWMKLVCRLLMIFCCCGGDFLGSAGDFGWCAGDLMQCMGDFCDSAGDFNFAHKKTDSHLLLSVFCLLI